MKTLKTCLFALLLLIAEQVAAQTRPSEFELIYVECGLGSNMGTMEPVIRIKGGRQLVYTEEVTVVCPIFEVGSPDTILITTIKESTVKHIVELVKDLRDTNLFDHNPCVLGSGVVHHTRVVVGGDTTVFDMMNTVHPTQLKIIEKLQPYLPPKKQLWVNRRYWEEAEKCKREEERRWAEERRQANERDTSD